MIGGFLLSFHNIDDWLDNMFLDYPILNYFISTNYSLTTRHNDKIDFVSCRSLYAVRYSIILVYFL